MSAKVTFLAPPRRRQRPCAPPDAGRSRRRSRRSSRATAGTQAFEVVDGVVKVRAGRHRRAARGSRRVVTQGLSGGETLVANPPEGLKDGDKVKVKGS